VRSLLSGHQAATEVQLINPRLLSAIAIVLANAPELIDNEAKLLPVIVTLPGLAVVEVP